MQANFVIKDEPIFEGTLLQEIPNIFCNQSLYLTRYMSISIHYSTKSCKAQLTSENLLQN